MMSLDGIRQQQSKNSNKQMFVAIVKSLRIGCAVVQYVSLQNV